MIAIGTTEVIVNGSIYWYARSPFPFITLKETVLSYVYCLASLLLAAVITLSIVKFFPISDILSFVITMTLAIVPLGIAFVLTGLGLDTRRRLIAVVRNHLSLI